MATQKRYDAHEVLRKPEKLPNGWLRVDAKITRTGVFPYRNPDGSIRRELRLPEEVFHSDTLKSFGLVPVTDEHPAEFLTAENTREYAAGAMGEGVRKDGDFVVGTMLITDADLVAKLERGDAREVSGGYTCELEQKAGEYNGQRYDCIQRSIRGNHVAIVPQGRAGPAASVRMDAAASCVISPDPAGGGASGTAPRTQEITVAAKARIDGVDVEFTTEQGAQLTERALKSRADELEKKDAEIKAAQSAVEKERARADAAEEKAKKLDAELKAAPEKLRADMKVRVELESSARKILGKEAKLDGLSDRQVKEKALAKLKPELKLDGKADAYVDARFDMALESAENADEDSEDRTDALDRARETADGVDDADGSEDREDADEPSKDSETAFEKMKKRNGSQWKKKSA